MIIRAAASYASPQSVCWWSRYSISWSNSMPDRWSRRFPAFSWMGDWGDSFWLDHARSRSGII